MQTQRATHYSEQIQSIRHDVELLSQAVQLRSTQCLKDIQIRFENIANAVFLATQHMSDRNIIATTMRDSVSDSVRLAMSFNSSDVRDEYMTIDSLIGHCQVLLSFIHIARTTHAMSETNSLLLEREILIIHSSLCARRSSPIAPYQEQSIVSLLEGAKNITTKEMSLEKKSVTPSLKSAIDTARSLRTPVITDQMIRTTEKVPTHSIRPVDNSVAGTSRGDDSSTDTATSMRALRIMNQLSVTPEMTIKDILPLFPTVSEKTIQRDIQALVNRGVITKTGERRWARYSMPK